MSGRIDNKTWIKELLTASFNDLPSRLSKEIKDRVDNLPLGIHGTVRGDVAFSLSVAPEQIREYILEMRVVQTADGLNFCDMEYAQRHPAVQMNGETHYDRGFPLLSKAGYQFELSVGISTVIFPRRRGSGYNKALMTYGGLTAIIRSYEEGLARDSQLPIVWNFYALKKD